MCHTILTARRWPIFLTRLELCRLPRLLTIGRLIRVEGRSFVFQPDAMGHLPKIVPESEISFFKNGVCPDVAFKNLRGDHCYPAASMYTLRGRPNCEVTFNFGPVSLMTSAVIQCPSP
uniref:Uncharacterized protein n=1 Tax=Kalanchoe fedtschenkoi TaxID=63787 RepID=A0A7N0TRA2_KALFE